MGNDKRALGKGLAALISESTISLIKNNQSANNIQGSISLQSDKVIELPIDSIGPNISQPRKSIGNQELAELAISIAKHGILQPILVKREEVDKFQIIAGERRWRAAKMANFITIPAIIKDQDEKTLFEIAIIENIQRENLKPLEEAEAYRKLMEDFGYTQENLSIRLGKSRAHITNMLRLLKLPEVVKTMIIEEKLTAGHGRALINSVDPILAAEEVVRKKLSVRQTEELAKGNKNRKCSNHREILHRSKVQELIEELIQFKTVDADLKQIEEIIKDSLNINVKIILENSNTYIIFQSNKLTIIDDLLALLSNRNKN